MLKSKYNLSCLQYKQFDTTCLNESVAAVSLGDAPKVSTPSMRAYELHLRYFLFQNEGGEQYLHKKRLPPISTYTRTTIKEATEIAQ